MYTLGMTASCTFRWQSERSWSSSVSSPAKRSSICKAHRKEGNRRFIEWQVKKESDSNGPPPLETPPPVNGQTNADAAPKLANGPAAASHLEQALTASLDAAIAAEQYAATKGFSVRFGSEDLRAMALGLFIQHSREGGLR